MKVLDHADELPLQFLVSVADRMGLSQLIREAKLGSVQVDFNFNELSRGKFEALLTRFERAPTAYNELALKIAEHPLATPSPNAMGMMPGVDQPEAEALDQLRRLIFEPIRAAVQAQIGQFSATDPEWEVIMPYALLPAKVA